MPWHRPDERDQVRRRAPDSRPTIGDGRTVTDELFDKRVDTSLDELGRLFDVWPRVEWMGSSGRSDGMNPSPATTMTSASSSSTVTGARSRMSAPAFAA
jgi:hypothetical protein